MSRSHSSLRRELGVWGATLMGLGSILGTGVFVSIGVAADITGPTIILTVAFAALIATCNGLNSAQLAANHAVSGGTYEYGYKYLTPSLGFTAGWMFLLAKTASGATAALGFAGYLLNATGLDHDFLIPVAIAAVVIMTLVILSGIQRSNIVNVIIVTITLFSLIFFIVAGLPLVISQGRDNLTPFFQTATDSNISLATVLHATALMFVAYTGYGRIATMSEEVREPRQTIPRAIITTMIVAMVLYMGISTVAVGSVGAKTLSSATQIQVAPLEVVASYFSIPGSSQILAVGAITAMLGVLLNLILGLSRVLLAMGRRGDLPKIVAHLNSAGTAPNLAVLIVGVAICALVLIDNVKITWSFSAFTVLVYYTITNLAALRLSPTERLYPKWLAWIGLAACLSLAFWVEQQIWLVGLGLILAGLLWKIFFERLRWAYLRVEGELETEMGRPK